MAQLKPSHDRPRVDVIGTRLTRVHWHINMELAASYLCFLSIMSVFSRNRKATRAGQSSLPSLPPVAVSTPTYASTVPAHILPGLDSELETYVPTPNMNHSSKRLFDRFKLSPRCTSHLCEFS